MKRKRVKKLSGHSALLILAAAVGFVAIMGRIVPDSGFKKPGQDIWPADGAQPRPAAEERLDIAEINKAESRYKAGYVYDGDTAKIFIGGSAERVRFIGIDAPETEHSSGTGRAERCAGEATAFLRGLLNGKKVRLETDLETRDRYGRLLAYVYLDRAGGELFVNAELVSRGLAVAKNYPPNTRRSAELFESQKKARDARLGLWSGGGTNCPF